MANININGEFDNDILTADEQAQIHSLFMVRHGEYASIKILYSMLESARIAKRTQKQLALKGYNAMTFEKQGGTL
jgi:hypothetical protein